MGSYLNPGGGMFKACLRSKIYVDKNGLIAKTNEVLGTEQRFVCVSRPRRFGKSMGLPICWLHIMAEGKIVQNCFLLSESIQTKASGNI